MTAPPTALRVFGAPTIGTSSTVGVFTETLTSMGLGATVQTACAVLVPSVRLKRGSGRGAPETG